MELVITTDLSTFPKLIEFNYPELKAALENSLNLYQGLVYGEDEIKNAKSDRATLNKLKTAIDTERKRMKAICLAPYNDFETKTKELVSMVDKPVAEIDAQIKVFEERKKAKRKQHLEDFYIGIAQDILEIVPFDRIFLDKWTNASVSPKAIESVISNTVSGIRKDMETIKGFGGEMTLQCMDVYLKTLNLSEALNEKTRLEELKAKVQESQPEPVKPEPVPVIQQVPQAEPEQKTYSVAFRVIATAKQLDALKAFLIDNAIHYERV